MRKQLLGLILAAPLMVGMPTSVMASESDVARLDSELTPTGAIRAGNAEGTIPPWTGGLATPPAGWQPGQHEIDPFPEDRPLFSITPENMSQYADKMTEGHKALLRQYGDTFFMPVYQSRRTAAYPERVYDALRYNAANAQLLENGNGVTDTIATSPFPIPQNGLEAIWNHILRFRGEEVSFRSAFATPTRDGSFNPVVTEYDYYMAYSEDGVSLEDIDNKIFYLRTRILAPATLAGTINLVHETLDQIRSPRLAWRYEAGERRLRRSPNLAYDTDLPNSSGFRTVDQKDMYNGAPNQYEWELKGRREIYVPYNAYRLHGNIPNSEIVRSRHINQERTRYELHRVWVVEAKLRTGIRHIYSRRVFYIDEDSWQILVSEEYDQNGELWRVSEAHNISFYSVPVFWTTLETTYDLRAERYYVDGLMEGQAPFDFEPNFRRNEFTAAAARRAAGR